MTKIRIPLYLSLDFISRPLLSTILHVVHNFNYVQGTQKEKEGERERMITPRGETRKENV